jgi:hemerythrin-like domain-containing protein
MEATRILMEEHRSIERVLTALQTAAQRVEQGEEMRPAFFLNAALFIKNFADGCHHHKEEGVLFKALQEMGMPVEGGPLGMMLSEHEQGRLFTAEMKDAAQKWEAGDVSARWVVIHNAKGYVALLRQHIQKEDGILFPLADRIVPVEKQEVLTAEFERIGREETEAGTHEKYLALAEVLEKESTRRIAS